MWSEKKTICSEKRVSNMQLMATYLANYRDKYSKYWYIDSWGKIHSIRIFFIYDRWYVSHLKYILLIFDKILNMEILLFFSSLKI